jgi:hypothetical protein
MKILKNKYLIWLIALIIFALSPQNSDFWSDIKGLYYYGFTFTYFEKYAFGFYSVSFWIIRVLSIILNANIAKARSDNSAIVFWILFALALPAFSLIINGFMTISDSKKRKRHLILLFAITFIIIVGIYFVGVTSRNKEYSIRVSNMNSFMKEFAKENLDTIMITRLDSLAQHLDTSHIENFVILTNDSLMKVETPGYIPVDSKLNLKIKYNSDSRIQYVIENNLTQPSGAAMSIFDSSGALVMRDIYFFYSNIELIENAKEYYAKGDLIKRVYLRKSTNAFLEDINDYLLDDKRYDFYLYKTVDDFKEIYNLD